MTRNITSSKIFLFLILPFLFISDVLYGAMAYYGIDNSLTPGVLLRGGLLLWAIFYVFRNSKIIISGNGKWLLVLTFLAFPGFFIGIVSGADFSYNLMLLSKLMLFPFLTYALCVFFEKNNFDHDVIFKYIEFVAYFLGVSLLLSQQLGLSSYTYGDYAYGSVGIFYAQNDLTLVLALSLIVAAYRLIYVRFTIIRLILLSLSLVACLKIGTNSALITPVIMACTIFVVHLTKANKSSLFNRTIQMVIFLFFVISLIITFKFVVEIFWSYDYQRAKIEALMRGELSRAPLIEAAEKHMAYRGILLNFFGEGFDSFHKGVSNYFWSASGRRFVESDPYDILGAHGFLFLISMYSWCFMLLFKNINSYFSEKSPGQYVVVASCLFLYISYSYLVGHALTSAIPATLIASFGALSIRKRTC